MFYKEFSVQKLVSYTQLKTFEKRLVFRDKLLGFLKHEKSLTKKFETVDIAKSIQSGFKTFII